MSLRIPLWTRLENTMPTKHLDPGGGKPGEARVLINFAGHLRHNLFMVSFSSFSFMDLSLDSPLACLLQ